MSRQALTEGLARLFNLESGAGRKTPYVMPEDPTEEAVRIAQQNAALPREQGGLGLSPDNTAFDRAQAMGYRIPFYHGTDRPNLTAIDPRFQERERVGSGSGAFGATADNPELAETYASKEGGVYPLLMRFDVSEGQRLKVGNVDFGGAFFDRGEDVVLTLPDGKEITSADDYRLLTLDTDDLVDIANQYGLDAIQASNIVDIGPYFKRESIKALKERGYLGENVPEELQSVYDASIDYRTQGGEELITFKEGMLRSPNAAFDPMRRNDPSLTASVEPITAIGLAGLAGSGLREGYEYLSRNLDPRTIADYGLATLAMTPSPLAVPAAATELGLFALDAANALSQVERESLMSPAGEAQEGEPRGQMKRKKVKPESDVPKYANGGVVDVIRKYRREGLMD